MNVGTLLPTFDTLLPVTAPNWPAFKFMNGIGGICLWMDSTTPGAGGTCSWMDVTSFGTGGTCPRMDIASLGTGGGNSVSLAKAEAEKVATILQAKSFVVLSRCPKRLPSRACTLETKTAHIG